MSFHDANFRSAPSEDRHDQAPRHEARDLVGKDGTGQITLDNKIYTLRITKAGKLILTK